MIINRAFQYFNKKMSNWIKVRISYMVLGPRSSNVVNVELLESISSLVNGSLDTFCFPRCSKKNTHFGLLSTTRLPY